MDVLLSLLSTIVVDVVVVVLDALLSLVSTIVVVIVVVVVVCFSVVGFGLYFYILGSCVVFVVVVVLYGCLLS